MKKLFPLFMCLIVLCTMFGCSKPKVDDEAIDRIIPAVQKFAELENFDYEIGLQSPVTNAKIYGSCILDQLQLSLFVDLEAEGMKSNKLAELYIADNMLYANGFGQKQKQEIDLQNMIPVSFDPETVSFDKDDLKKHLKKASVNNDTLHFEIKEDTVKDAVKSGDINVGELGLSEVNEVMFDIETKDEFINQISFTFVGLNDKEKATITVYVQLDNINQRKSLEFPKDMNSWPTAKKTK